MTHNEARSHWLKDTGIGLGVGVLYGLTSVTVGHPFDTIKTKMQAQVGFEGRGMIGTLKAVLRKDGFIGFYRGSIPPLCGSGIYRSVQFAVFEGIYTLLNTPFGSTEIPFTGGIQKQIEESIWKTLVKCGNRIFTDLTSGWNSLLTKISINHLNCTIIFLFFSRIVIAGVIAASVRATIECPLEYAKIRRQTNQSWTMRGIYTGYGVTLMRTGGLMTSFFIQIDTLRRYYPEVLCNTLWGPFLTAGMAATFSWWLVWPLEVVKSQKQGNYGPPMSTWQRLKLTIREHRGPMGLYRGLMPGTIRGFVANGASMAVMQWAHKKVSQLGLRD